MDGGSIVSLLVAVVAALAAILSQRSISKASTANVNSSSRVEMEKEAYDRARAYDTETISRQDTEIKELRADHELCNQKIDALKEKYEAEIDVLRRRIARLEGDVDIKIQEILRERLNEPDIEDTAS